MKNTKIIAHIPARYGSSRVKIKNLKPLAGRPLLSYSIDAAKSSRKLSEFYVNTESEKIAAYARQCGAKVFLRDSRLATSEVSQDTFNYDFIMKVQPDILVLVNPVSPLIVGSDIDAAIIQLLEGDLDTVISVSPVQLHCVYNNSPVNFDSHTILPRTQDIEPVLVCNWAVCVWRVTAFKEQFEKQGHASLVGKIGYLKLPPIKGIKISTEEDFELAEAIIKGSEKK